MPVWVVGQWLRQEGPEPSFADVPEKMPEPRRDDLAFSAADHRQQPSAWSRDLLYGGGLGMAALVLALGWGLMRPVNEQTIRHILSEILASRAP